jgi:hypothetical protein
MATFFLDFEGGNDANDGTTFANRWKTFTSGATAARIAPGDTIRIMGSPAPTSLGVNGTWTSEALAASKSITAATNATPISVTCTGHGYSTGDTIVLTGDTGNTAANGTWEITVTDADTFTLDGSVGNGTSAGTRTARLRNNTRVLLASAVTQNIASTGPGRAAWTASANVTATLNTATKQHYQSDNIAIGTAFTTGLAAYWATGTLDLSGYQQVSFWIRQTSGTIGASGGVDLRLCSDALGVTAVNTVSIPTVATSNQWMPVTVDLSTNLGNSIQSIALYVNTDNGAQTFQISNVIACKASSAADSLTLTSLIGKNTTGETFWAIQSINGTRVMLDNAPATVPTDTFLRGYYGTSETVTTYKRETIRLGPFATITVVSQTAQDSGTATSFITFSGGWDRTDMSTQTLETWIDGVNGLGIGIENQRNFTALEKIGFVRWSVAYRVNSISMGVQNLSFVAVNNCNLSAGPVETIGKGGVHQIDAAVANRGNAIAMNATTGTSRMSITCPNASCNGGLGALVVTMDRTKVEISAYNNALAGLGFEAYSFGGVLINCKTKDNAGGGVENNRGFSANFVNFLCEETTEISPSTSYDYYLYSQNHDQTTDNHKVFMFGGLISSATDQRHTASGISWKLQPTSTTNRNALYPVILSLAKIACAANSMVTVKAWMRRTNTDLTMRLVCKGGQIAGVDTDVVDSMTAAANTWAEQTITFTPTEVGVVEITAEAYGGSTFSGWVDDMTISQA